MFNSRIISANIVISLFALVLFFSYEHSYKAITCLSLIQVLINSYAFYKVKNYFLSVGFSFIVLAYFFHFGHNLLDLFYPDIKHSERMVVYMSSERAVVKASLYAIISFASVTIGYILNSKKKTRNNIQRIDMRDVIFYRKLFWLLFAISLFPMLFIDITKMAAMSVLGYDATYSVYNEGIGKYLGVIARFGRPCIAALIFCYSNKPKIAKRIFLLSSIYYVGMLISGDRGTYIISLLGNIIVYYTFVQKLTFKKVMILSFFGILVLAIISTVSIFRFSDFSIESFNNSYEARNEDGFVYSLLREFGVTMISLVNPMIYFTHFNYGITYLMPIINMSPYLPSDVVSYFATSITFTNAMPKDSNYFESLGGSFLGEAYFNFGWLGSIFLFYAGLLLAKIDNILSHSVNIVHIVMAILIIPGLILWVRDFFVGIFFVPFWVFIFLKVFRR